jgi:hypothetical protein
MLLPFRIEQNASNCLVILDEADEELCQFYCEGDDVDEATITKAEFVLRRVNEPHTDTKP